MQTFIVEQTNKTVLLHTCKDISRKKLREIELRNEGGGSGHTDKEKCNRIPAIRQWHTSKEPAMSIDLAHEIRKNAK